MSFCPFDEKEENQNFLKKEIKYRTKNDLIK